MNETVAPEQITVLEQKVEALQRDLEPANTKTETADETANNNGTDVEDEETETVVDSASDDPSSEAATDTIERPDSSLTYEEYQAKKKSLLKSVGKTTEAEKDGLSEIVGVGPFIEAKLNSIGIYTYEQIGRFSDEDVENVTRLIEFFPGRIERDGWVRQAAKLLKKKQEA